MDFRPLAIEGAWEVTPRQFPDARGMFAEGFRADKLAAHIGHLLAVRQTNISVSVAGAVRGIHYAALPPSQAKYVTALDGVFLDFVVDLRVGSPTFGEWDCVRLDTLDRRAVYLSEGLGHALACLENGTAFYLCSEVYDPVGERAITPLDPTVGLVLPGGPAPVLSPRDTAAPSLLEAREAGLLPDYEDCLAYRRGLA
jgi:dTDP-4-dehydrorhamnose 3,5-epimerase